MLARMTTPLQLDGLVAAVHSPLDASGDLDLGAVEGQADHLASKGVVAVFVAGTTGEGPSLAEGERRALLESWVPVARQRGRRRIAGSV